MQTIFISLMLTLLLAPVCYILLQSFFGLNKPEADLFLLTDEETELDTILLSQHYIPLSHICIVTKDQGTETIKRLEKYYKIRKVQFCTEEMERDGETNGADRDH